MPPALPAVGNKTDRIPSTRVNVKARTVAVYTSPTHPTVLMEKDALDGGVVLPGFRLPLHQLFRHLDQAGSQRG